MELPQSVGTHARVMAAGGIPDVLGRFTAGTGTCPRRNHDRTHSRLDDPFGAALVQIGLSLQLRLARREQQAMEAAEAAIPPLRQRGLTLLEVEALTAYLVAAVIAAPELARQRLPAAVSTCHTVGLPAHAEDLARLVHRRFLG